MPNIFTDPELYDKTVVSGVPSPGIVTLRGHDREVKWDRKEGGGQDGESTTRKGQVAIEFTATYDLVVDVAQGLDEETMWKEGFLPVLNLSYEATTPTALDIYHPDLAANKIGSVVVRKIGGIEHVGKGAMRVTVTYLQHRPAKKKPAGKPSGSKSKSPIGAQTETDPLQQHKDTLSNLIDEAKTPL